MEHLIEGHNYNFRVKAVNKIGESLPLTGQSPITAKDPYKKPDKPGVPQMTGECFIIIAFYVYLTAIERHFRENGQIDILFSPICDMMLLLFADN